MPILRKDDYEKMLAKAKRDDRDQALTEMVEAMVPTVVLPRVSISDDPMTGGPRIRMGRSSVSIDRFEWYRSDVSADYLRRTVRRLVWKYLEAPRS